MSKKRAVGLKANSIRSLTKKQRAKFLSSLSDEECQILLYDWNFWARENQLEPQGDWQTWAVIAGRGYGKTRVSVEQLLKWKRQGYKRFAIVAQTPGEARDVLIQGESGILACSPPWDYPNYEPSKRRITWNNGAQATIYSGNNPEQLRGPQHEKALVDELAKFKYPQDTWDNLQFGLRLGDNPQSVIATTPRPIPTLKEILKDDTTVITRGTTYDNKANLADSFMNKIIKKYEGTRLGRQELHAEMLDDNPNALWTRDLIENTRLNLTQHDFEKLLKTLTRIVVGVDPAVTFEETSDSTGIVVAGIDANEQGYVLDDATLKASSGEWAKKVVDTFHKWQADKVIGEANNGGDMIEFMIRSFDKNIPYEKVTATRGKMLRAEPIASLYEQGRVHHVGIFPELEDQMCEWEPGDSSPDNLDASVWGLTELFKRYTIEPINIPT